MGTRLPIHPGKLCAHLVIAPAEQRNTGLPGQRPERRSSDPGRSARPHGNDVLAGARGASATGALFYDDNGNGRPRHMFAVLTNKPAIAANDFKVIRQSSLKCVLRGSLRSHLTMRWVAHTPPVLKCQRFSVRDASKDLPHPEVRAKRASKDTPSPLRVQI
jgi:hypothetical protein